MVVAEVTVCASVRPVFPADSVRGGGGGKDRARRNELTGKLKRERERKENGRK